MGSDVKSAVGVSIAADGLGVKPSVKETVENSSSGMHRDGGAILHMTVQLSESFESVVEKRSQIIATQTEEMRDRISTPYGEGKIIGDSLAYRSVDQLDKCMLTNMLWDLWNQAQYGNLRLKTNDQDQPVCETGFPCQ